MIFPPNDFADSTTSEFELESQPATEDELPREAAPPPVYDYPSEQYASSSNTIAQPTFKSKPTNYLYLFSEQSSIKGEYVINPFMNIPTYLLSPLLPEESETDRKNLCLNSTNGSVNVDIWLLSARDKTPIKRTTLDLGSEHGSVTARVQTIQGTSPFLLTISAKTGAVQVTLPRSFNGLLLLTSTYGSVSLADTLSEDCIHLSQVDTTRRYFVGDLSTVDDNDWTGDEVRVEAKHGKIRVEYIEENTCANDTTKGGFLSRLFGR